VVVVAVAIVAVEIAVAAAVASAAVIVVETAAASVVEIVVAAAVEIVAHARLAAMAAIVAVVTDSKQWQPGDPDGSPFNGTYCTSHRQLQTYFNNPSKRRCTRDESAVQ
jgi:hypothetical protein